MRRVLRWMMLGALCCAAGAAANEAPADARLQEAQTALDEATKLQKEGKYAEAVPKGEHALALREAVLGDTHVEVAACLNLLGELNWGQGEYVRAEPLYQRALAIRETALGKNHPLVAETLNAWARLHLAQHHLAQAQPLLARAFTISE